MALLSFLAFQAQEVVTISKKDLEQKINDQNLQLKLSEAEINSAKADLLMSRAMYLPNVTACATPRIIFLLQPCQLEIPLVKKMINEIYANVESKQ